MTLTEFKNLFIRELTMPSEKLKTAHPTIWRAEPSFVDYTEDGELTLSFPVHPDQRNGYQLLQGGILSSFFDDVFGLFVFVASSHNPVSTIQMNVSYHRGVRPETDTVLVTSRVIRAGKNIVSLEAVAKDPGGNLVATCQTSMLNVNHVKLNYLANDE